MNDDYNNNYYCYNDSHNFNHKFSSSEKYMYVIIFHIN